MGNRIFSAAQRVAILKAVPDRPTGVVFEYAGMEFDLLAIPNATFLEILGTIEESKDFAGPGGTWSESRALAFIGTKGRRLLELAKETLRRSAFYGVARPAAADVAVFDEWFDALPALDLIRALAPKVLQAAGASAVVADPSTPTPGQRSKRREKTA